MGSNYRVLHSLLSLSKLSLLGYAGTAWLLYLVGLVVYRVYLSPLARFPGRKIAAATWWYEFYWDVIRPGEYCWEVKRMHEEFGPIIRISPHEIHINDPTYWETLYKQPNDKWEWGIRAIGLPESTVGTVKHDLHKRRRAALSPFFSRRSVERVGHVIYENIANLVSRLDDARMARSNAIAIGSSSRTEDEDLDDAAAEVLGIVNMSALWHCLAVDIVTEYAFAQSYGLVKNKRKGGAWVAMLKAVLENSNFIKHFPVFLKIRDGMAKLPDWAMQRMGDGVQNAFALQKDMRVQIGAIQRGETSDLTYKAHPTIFHSILESESIPPEEKRLDRLWQDGQSVIVGGSETVAKVLTHTTFHLLDKPAVLARLRSELEEGGYMTAEMKRKGENPRWQDLERCAYLQAVVAEGLRVSLPAVQRMNRVLPTKPRLYTDPQTQNEWHIPPNTPVSMSAHLLHFDERVFPRPHEFLPERWLDDPTLEPTLPGVRSKTKDVSGKEGGGHGSGITDRGGKIDRELGKYIASFGYGTRICVGMKYVLDFRHGLRIYSLSFFLLAPPSTAQIIFLLSFSPIPSGSLPSSPSR
ncbi:hypothetical protein B0A49_01646 [Cryomyces minteri]|uniref:Trichodiene oxygenase n=1 Tax=Cryomyces minteri TaxID=331657 RepID=A0A4U0XPK6_9PEZI|nr:hypothetical protein B0A49_01646 [Cryomyces minteri]